ncbi:MAG: tol-pal system YbgF family protein [Eubacterium sp.]
MNKDEINKIVKRTNFKGRAVSISTLIIAFALIIFAESPIKYIVGFFIIIAGVFLRIKIQDVSYLLFDRCNPQMYYAAAQGILKQVPVDKQALTAEFIGDYSSAIKILNSIIENTKSSASKLFYISETARNAFLAGDYELCKRCIADFNQLSKGKRINEFVKKRNDFYLLYINGDFKGAKEILAKIDKIPKKQKNSFICNMMYLNAVTDYSMNNYESAKEEFEKIVNSFPHMYLAQASKKYISSITNNTPVEINQPLVVELPKSAQMPLVTKKDILKSVIGILIIFACIIVVPAVINMQSFADTPNKAIEKYDEAEVLSIDYTLEIDDNHIVCIYENSDELLGVAYLEINDNKYQCKIANCDDYALTSNDRDSHPSAMHSSGISSEIIYKWISDKENTPDGYNTVALNQNDKTVYFCYKINPPERYYSSLYKLVTNE